MCLLRAASHEFSWALFASSSLRRLDLEDIKVIEARLTGAFNNIEDLVLSIFLLECAILGGLFARLLLLFPAARNIRI